MKTSHVALCAILVLLMAEAQVTMAVTCNPTQLSPCVNAFTSNSKPSKLCCSRINEQKPCLCQYLKDPRFARFVNSPNARNVAKTCGTPYPKC
uniref:Bifunctional inhibitor/plant lipid transfer protein/seed storage helical domain-containing protein n=1 Tax=Rhizophora mucronata TaxID=61149 RepID=A0A2P2QS48_RHIMU